MGVPEIKAVRTIARSRFFRIEELDLKFSNGVERTYERLPGSGRAAVMVVAVNAADELVLIREYAAGFHEMQLTLVKGAVDDGESLEEAANRELKEEAGFGARDIRFIKKLNLAPGHMGFTINVVLALDLYPEKLAGDQPEPLEVVCWPLAELDELITGDEFREARAIAGLYLARHYLEETRDLDEKLLGEDNAVPTTDTRVVPLSTEQEKTS
jgi:ADP-ribose diphosphatase